MKTKYRIIPFILSAVLSAALVFPAAAAVRAADIPPLGPDNIHFINGITYTEHPSGVGNFTDELVAVLEIAPDADAKLLAGVPHYDYLQGYATLEQMAEAYTAAGHDVIAAVNGGFFGLRNPPGAQVVNQGVFIHDGELLRHWAPRGTNDYVSQEHYIIGTLDNGDFFYGHNPLHTMHISVNGGEERELIALNSPRVSEQPHWRDLTLLTDRFAESIPSVSGTFAGTDVKLEVISGKMAFGEEFVMRVVKTAHTAEAGAYIGKGYALLTAANNGEIRFLNTLREGDIVTVKNNFTNRRGTRTDWNRVSQAIPANFLLIAAGRPQPLPRQPNALEPLYPDITPNPNTETPLPLLPGQNTKRPRTALGIRSDGTMVWVVVSGSGNTGMTIPEFQSYLMSLNLHYAWNFDGGGSSAMLIGEKQTTYSNGAESNYRRPVANGVVLVIPPLPDNTVEIVIPPQNTEFIQGSSGSVYVRARGGAGELNYQWYQNGEPAGDNSPVFVMPADIAAATHEFYVVVSAEGAEPKTSGTAVVRVKLPFDDINDDDWFIRYVSSVYNLGIMSGVNPGMFGPNSTLTRGMLVTMIYRHAGMPDISGLNNPFTDIPEGEWYTGAVIWAAHNGIIQGVGEDRFAPMQNITREQIAAVIFRYAEAAGFSLPENNGEPDFTDRRDISDWASDAVDAVFKAGIITGRPGGLFDPKNEVTRAEAAAILHRFTDIY
ncbi:MAG: S-layer homology domain-containing protein [Oscillospiraceae bacterium]|nr:S-layer homology domain-containing protein [Oscillospiraceae bacterium]